MRLKSVRIRKFRNIVDSGELLFDDSLTCLVGLNEAGKTSFLQALLRIKPHGKAELVVKDDYPRWLWKKDQREDTIGSESAISAVFELDDADVTAMEDRFGAGVMASRTVTVSRWYNEPQAFVTNPANGSVLVAAALSKLDISNEAREAFGQANSLAAVRKVLAELESKDGWQDDVAEVKAVFDGDKNPFDRSRNAIWARVPTFFYFDEYALLPGRINIASLNGADAIASTGTQTARALLNLANTSPEELVSDDYEDRKAELEAVSADLTDEIFTYWKQNANLRVAFDLDKDVRLVPTNNGYPDSTRAEIDHYLEIRVENTEHRYTSNIDRRSHGFQWFFSFLAAFTEFEAKSKGTNFIVLLDEPGLSLHGLAQRDLLTFLNDRLGSAVQVVYTTHSPFMVETDRIERIRIVEDKGKSVGAKVTQDVLGVNDNSLFPLQAALGYDATQHLFVGKDNVAVEGASDVVFLTVLSARMAATERTPLHARWSLLPTDGASNLPAYIALLGARTDLTVVMDSGTEGGGRIQAALDAGRIHRNRLIRVGEVVSRTHADIEDLFTVADYLTLFNKAYNTSITEANLEDQKASRIVERLKAHHGSFDHYGPADALMRNPDLVDALSAETLDNFEELFKKINSSHRSPRSR